MVKAKVKVNQAFRQKLKTKATSPCSFLFLCSYFWKEYQYLNFTLKR